MKATDLDPLHDRRAGLWLPLLRRLTREVDNWLVWKRVDSALTGPEDVDAVAPLSSWRRIERVFRDWAREHGFAVVLCRHVPWTLNLLAVAEEAQSLLQLEVRDRGTFRGAPLFTAQRLLPLATVDARGLRTVRLGAAGVLRMTMDGLRRGGAPNWAALEEHGVVEMLRDDPEGARAAASLYGAGRNHLLRAIDAALAGGWDARAMRRVELLSSLRAPLSPHLTVRRLWFRRVGKQRCPVLQTVYAGRRIPGSPQDWLLHVAGSHTVYRAGAHLRREGSGRGDSAPTPRGRFIVVVGPDGVGKTTLAATLLERHAGSTGYVYFRPPLRGHLPSEPPSGPRPRGNKYPPRQPIILGWLRLLKNIAWFWIGYLRVVRPMRNSGALVIGDRWGYGYVTQPGSLAYFGPRWLARMGIRLMPQPDLIVNLAAPAEVVAARKDELTAAEIERELIAWLELPLPRLVTFDATAAPGKIAAEVEAWFERHGDTPGAGVQLGATAASRPAKRASREGFVRKT